MKLYKQYFIMHLKGQMQYKTSFVLSTIAQFLVPFSSFIGIHFLFMRFENIGGFTREEVMLTFAVMHLAFAFGEFAGRGFDYFPLLLGNGGFDRALVRPRNVVFQILISQMHFHRIGRLTQALVVFIYALPRTGIVWTWDNVLTLSLMIVFGSVLFFSLFVLYAAFTFFTVEGLEFMNVFTDGGREHGTYPFSIYGDGILRFLTFVVPLALVQYYPLLYITGRTDRVFNMFTPVLAALFLLPCYLFFRFGMRRYKSVGS